MSYSKNISNYDPEWQAILEQFGDASVTDDVNEVVLGPYERNKAIRTRGEFYFFRGLVQQSFHSTPEAIAGTYRTIIELTERDGGWCLVIKDRHRNQPPIRGLTRSVRIHQDIEVAASAALLSEGLARQQAAARAVDRDPTAELLRQQEEHIKQINQELGVTGGRKYL